MTKKEALKQLANDFKNNLIAQGITDIENIEDETDRGIAKALKISLQNERG